MVVSDNSFVIMKNNCKKMLSADGDSEELVDCVKEKFEELREDRNSAKDRRHDIYVASIQGAIDTIGNNIIPQVLFPEKIEAFVDHDARPSDDFD